MTSLLLPSFFQATAARASLGAASADTLNSVSTIVSAVSNGLDDTAWQGGADENKVGLSPAQNKLAIVALESSAGGVPSAFDIQLRGC